MDVLIKNEILFKLALNKGHFLGSSREVTIDSFNLFDIQT